MSSATMGSATASDPPTVPITLTARDQAKPRAASVVSSSRKPQTRRRAADKIASAAPSALATVAADEVHDRLQDRAHCLLSHPGDESWEQRDQ